MTEIEARGKIKYRIANEMRKAGENKEEYEDLEIALQVMKEIREYRELGTVEGYERAIKSSIENYNLYREYKAKVQAFEAIGTVEEFEQLLEYKAIGSVDSIKSSIEINYVFLHAYEEIGTVEELKALKEKNVAKKPILSKSMMTKREFQICPICERLVLYDGIKFNHCQYCGQKLDWE